MTGFSSSTPVPNTKGVWYFLEIYECPPCGKWEVHKTRMLPPKPEYGYGKTYRITDVHCGCMY